MKSITPRDIPLRELFELLLGGVAPRPIALVSTLDADGRRNLSPFSFFNCFGANPPMIGFSPSRRQRDASVKDTYNNILATKECVVQAVTFNMVQQVNLASSEYPAVVDEFVKSGLTPIPSDIVKPARVAESPFQMECILREMVSFGENKASANVALCEVVKIHVAESILTDGVIDPHEIDLVARMGADWYCRASGSALFRVKKPGPVLGVGYDRLPEHMRRSDIFSANNLGQFGACERIPPPNEVEEFLAGFTPLPGDERALLDAETRAEYRVMFALALAQSDPRIRRQWIERSAKCALLKSEYDFAWKAALVADPLR